jgi:hypothetical protein
MKKNYVVISEIVGIHMNYSSKGNVSSDSCSSPVLYHIALFSNGK